MQRLNFLADDPWDEMNGDVNRVRWFGHPFATDMLGASLIEYLPRAPDTPLHMRGVAWVATRHPERAVPDGGDRGIIARFELPRAE